MIKKVIAYLLAQLLRLWVTAMTAIAVYCPLSELAYAERGYHAIGGEIVPVILIAGAVWVGMGWICEEWYRHMRRQKDNGGNLIWQYQVKKHWMRQK